MEIFGIRLVGATPENAKKLLLMLAFILDGSDAAGISIASATVDIVGFPCSSPRDHHQKHESSGDTPS